MLHFLYCSMKCFVFSKNSHDGTFFKSDESSECVKFPKTCGYKEGASSMRSLLFLWWNLRSCNQNGNYSQQTNQYCPEGPIEEPAH